MGLDVGVVSISYLERPAQPIYDFLQELADDAAVNAGAEYWGGTWDSNALTELERRKMLAKARQFAKEEALLKSDTDKLTKWVRSLPWDGNTIMLHFNW